MKEIEPKCSAASWLAELAKGRYGEYALSVLAALLGVACSLIPYFIIIQIITALVGGTAELTQCLTLCAWMAGFWVLRYLLHSVSTSLSHHATFHVLFYPQLGVKLCSMAGGGVQKIYMVFLREPSRRDRSGSDLFHLWDGFEIKMNFDRNVSCFIFVNALMHDDFFD